MVDCSVVFQNIVNWRGGCCQIKYIRGQTLFWITALQLMWLHWCNTDKNEISVEHVRPEQPECENSCGDGSEYGVLHSRWAQFPFGLVDREAFFFYTPLV